MTTVDYQRAYGTGIAGLGFGLIMIALLAPVSQCVGYSGSIYHNKFLLTLHAAFDFVLLLMQFSIGFSLLEISLDHTLPDTREYCVMSNPEGSGEECPAYSTSARYIGFKLVWAARFELVNTGDPSEYATMITWQRSGGCCGYGPPMRCEVDSQAIPADLLLDGVPSAYTDQATFCGDSPSWYPVVGLDNNLCEQAIDKTAAVLKYGGCKYEMPLGQCKELDPAETDRGCASFLQQMFDEEISGHALGIITLCLIEILSVIMACCYCWKRKSFDVMPAYLEQVPYDPYAKNANVNTLDGDVKLEAEAEEADPEEDEEEIT